MRAFVLVVLFAAASNSAQAEGYYGVNISLASLARIFLALESAPCCGTRSNALGALAGYRLNEYLAGEVGVSYYDGTNLGNRFLSLVWSADIVGSLPLAEGHGLYAKAGVANASPGIYGLTMNAFGQNMFGKTYGFGLLLRDGDTNIRLGAEHVPVGLFANGPQADVSYQLQVTKPF